MHIIGIDPGLTGAAACLDTETHELEWIEDIATEAKPVGKGRRLDVAETYERLFDSKNPFDNRAMVVLEHSQAMGASRHGRAQGVGSAFSTGDTYGALRAAVNFSGLPCHVVMPAVWKRAAGLIGKPKEAALTLARQLHPEVADMLKRKKDHNRAEAILIARHGLTLIPSMLE